MLLPSLYDGDDVGNFWDGMNANDVDDGTGCDDTLFWIGFEGWSLLLMALSLLIFWLFLLLLSLSAARESGGTLPPNQEADDFEIHVDRNSTTITSI